MKNLVHSLSYLAPFNHRISHRAASHLLARAYVLEHPISSPDDCDAELSALYASEAISDVSHIDADGYEVPGPAPSSLTFWPDFTL